jgi:translation initiation factor 1 (eIF-1/SUI1)
MAADLEPPDDLSDPNTKKSRRITIEYCDQCRVPLCYCRFFGHDRAPPPPDDPILEEEDLADSAALPVYHGPRQLSKPTKDGPRPNIVVTVKSRTRRKNTTTIAGLEAWDIDIREFAKTLAKTQAIGCSSKKTETGTAIVIQGDVGTSICDQLVKEYHIPAASITAIRKQQKKRTAADLVAKCQPAPQPEPDMGSSSDEDLPPEHPIPISDDEDEDGPRPVRVKPPKPPKPPVEREKIEEAPPVQQPQKQQQQKQGQAGAPKQQKPGGGGGRGRGRGGGGRGRGKR